MDKTEKLRQAKQLQKNKVLWEEFDSYAESIHEDWQQASSAEIREQLWLELKVLTKFREEINERIRQYTGDGE